jgi:glycosyltransferase involved in cell wall biosynthesis
MKILALTIGSREAGSTKFRLYEYASFFKENQMHIDWLEQKDIGPDLLERVRAADVVINQKCLLNKRLGRLIRNNARHLLFDFDDAIWTRPKKPYGWWAGMRTRSRLKFWLESSDIVVPANAYLSEYAERYTNKVKRIPMALDLDLWKPLAKEREEIRIGWAGAPVNLHHIERLDTVLTEVLQLYPNLSLHIFSGQKPQLNCPYTYTPFRDGAETAFIQQLDIGLLPLVNEEFSLGKSPIKAIQYISCGVPVVGNVYGATHDILNASNSLAVETAKDWKRALIRLIEERDEACRLGRQGRLHAEEHFSKNIIQKNLLDAIKNVQE